MAASRWRRLGEAGIGGALLLAAGCATAPAARPHAVAPELRSFLPSPVGLASRDTEAWQRLHDRLVSGGDPAEIARQAASLGAQGGPSAATLLEAEATLVAGDAAGALAAAAGGFEWQLQLVAGRAAEETGDPVDALAHYLRAEGDSPVAAARAKALAGPAGDAIAGRAEAALKQGHTDQASQWVERLAELEPNSERTYHLEVESSRQRGDAAGELRALTELIRRRPDRDDWISRRAQLEIETGDPGAALQLLEGLAERHPEDTRIPSEIARAKFEFRLSNVPPDVRAIASSPEVMRAGFARLLYWLMPEVRTGHGGAPPIATDLVDYPARDEILKVLSLGLMSIDQSLHLFAPDRPVDRSEALRALLARPGAGGPVPCARDGLAGRDLCAAAAACGLFGEPGDCLPSGTLSGREAVNWIEASGEAAGGPP